MDRLISILAACVGLIALAGAVLVQVQMQGRFDRVSAELSALRLAVETTAASVASSEAAAEPVDDGTVEALLALQDRITALEEGWRDAAAAAAAAAVSAETAAQPAQVETPAAPAPTDTAGITTDGPVEDCIPLGTRFMAVPAESYPICRTAVVIGVEDITGESVTVEGAGPIAETSFKGLPGTPCTVMVFSADIEGFAEMRVSC